MKRIRKGLYLITVILTLFLPMQAAAAGQDAVSMVQEEDKVAIVLEMGNAEQEKISAVAVSVQIGEESKDKVNVEFEFGKELAGAEEGFLYDESTGVLDIYAASDKSLFNGEILNLGHVRVTLKDSGQILPVEISYRGASFQTANEIYGSKRPMVARIPEPVNMQVGEGVSYVVSTEILEKWLAQAQGCKREDYSDAGWENLQKAIQEANALLAQGGFSQNEVNAMVESLRQMIANVGGGAGGDTSGGENPGDGNSGSGNPGGGTGSDNTTGGNGNPGQDTSGGSASGGGSVDEGLQDENTEFVNDPSSAQNVSSAVVKKNELQTEFVDMSQGAAAAIGGGIRPGTGTQKWTRPEGKVSVVSPEKGPASIFVASGGSNSSEGTSLNGEDEAGEDISQEGESFSGEEEGVQGEEILLDQKNGGAKDGQDEKRNRILLGVVITIVCAGGLGLGAFAVVKAKGTSALKKKKKPVRKRHKKPDPKKRKRP